MMKRQVAWESGIDPQFVQRLKQREYRPGVWDQQYALRLIAQHTRRNQADDLSARLNRRWQALDEELAAPVPIVYATPVAPVVLSEQSGSTIQQTVINGKQSVWDELAAVSAAQPARDTTAPPIVTPGQALPPNTGTGSLSTSASEAAISNATGTPKQVAGETAVSKTTPVRTPPLPLRASPAPPSQPQLASRPDHNAAPAPQSKASAPPLPLVTAQTPAPTADLDFWPNGPRRTPSASQPISAGITRRNSASTQPLPLITAQPLPAETAVLPTNPTHSVGQPSQPPGWMKKQVGSQRTPDAEVNIDTLTNKVEKQLLQRLLIQRERRGKA